MVVLITGGTGALGSALKVFFPQSLCPSHNELDITKKQMVLDFLKNNDVDTIIHTAALTSVRKCEEKQSLAWNVNVEGTKNLVESVIQLKSKINFIYVSTACVFDGKSGMYTENSLPYPENFYSLTKLLGEFEVSNLPNSLIIRTNFVPKKPWPYEKAFSDRFGTYLFADQVANGINDVIKERLTGIVHVVGDKKMSVFELAQMSTPNIKPMTIKDYSGPKLTMDMSLNTVRWKKYKINN
jgi:dTDP-4-dehydrorhamnose reductase|tara:strand:- start:3737 stop:4456 length:720 start_codon:yes stop_codon:yes gene_type:complete